MTSEHPRTPLTYSPDETPPPPAMPAAESPEAEGPEEYDSDPKGGGAKMPQPKDSTGQN